MELRHVASVREGRAGQGKGRADAVDDAAPNVGQSSGRRRYRNLQINWSSGGGSGGAGSGHNSHRPRATRPLCIMCSDSYGDVVRGSAA